MTLRNMYEVEELAQEFGLETSPHPWRKNSLCLGRVNIEFSSHFGEFFLLSKDNSTHFHWPIDFEIYLDCDGLSTKICVKEGLRPLKSTQKFAVSQLRTVFKCLIRIND